MPYFGFGYLNIPIKSINMDVGQRIANEIGESLFWSIFLRVVCHGNLLFELG